MPVVLCAMPNFSGISNSLRLHGLQPARLLCPWGFSRQEYWGGLPCSPPGDLPNPEIKPSSPTMQMDSLLTEPPGKPMNTGAGSLTLLQGIFPTQESSWGLVHCRRSLYQLSYQGCLLGIILKMTVEYVLQKSQSPTSKYGGIGAFKWQPSNWDSKFLMVAIWLNALFFFFNSQIT